MEKWAEIGKAEGLEGESLLQFVRERESAAREERVQLLELKRNEIAILELKTKLSESRIENEETLSKPKVKVPKLPIFNEEKDDLDSYLLRFEKYAVVHGWPRDTWALNLSALLSGKALQVYARLPARSSQDYDQLREALFKRFNLTEEGFRKKFRNARPEKDENSHEFILRLDNLFDRWLQLANIGNNFYELKKLMVREQFLSKCSPDLLIFLKEHGVSTLEELGQLAEDFVEARRSTFSQFCQPDRKPSSATPNRPSTSQPQKMNQSTRPMGPPNRLRPPRTGYICKRPGHLANDCRFRSTPVHASFLQETGNDVEELADDETGNISGVRCPSDPDPEWKPDYSPPEIEQPSTDGILDQAQAVQTRAQKARTDKPAQPLRVPPPITDVVTAKSLLKEQQSDSSLSRCFQLAQDSDPKVSKDGSVSRFLVEKGILYRENKDPKTDVTDLQVVLPTSLRQQVMKIAHESLLGGHQGIKKTSDRILRNFYWPGIIGDISRFVQSCDICQRTFPKGRVQKVPLGDMPIIDTPFKRVAVDIVGPIEPRTSRGNKYILTLVDFATRYPEAIAMKNIEAVTIVDALVDIFSRIGVPQEILSDRGSQFTSGLFAEVTKLLSLRQLFTTPYHPAGNGLVERFNGTLKLMLRRMCAEKPTDWDRYLGALLFAYREAPQASLGFSPFELIYGRRVRGPLTLLKELWTGESPHDETRSTYEYVFELQNKLQDTCKLAHEHLKKAKESQQAYYNKKSRNRSFAVGDKVLLLLPTANNKLLLHWKGPFPVVGRQGQSDYKIDLNGQIKTFHANLLKAYHERNEAAAMITQDFDIPLPNKSVCCQTPALTAKEGPSQVHVNEELSETQKTQLREVLGEYADVLTDLPGKTDVMTHDIQLTSSEPFRKKQYPIPHALQTTVRKEVEDMLTMEIIEPSQSPYASPIVLIDKKDGSKRFCIDFRTLNRMTVFDAEPLPDPEHIFASISQDCYFSKLDLTKGYWQVPVAESAKPYTAFLTPAGLFQFRMMPFGLVNAPATFTRMMRQVLQGLEKTDNFIDDILIHTKTWENHIEVLTALLERLRSVHLTAKPSKCEVGCQSLEFLGHVVGKGTLRPQSDKLLKIQDAKPPRTKKELRSFLGFVGYYRRFIPNFAAVASPLTDLTKAKLPNRIEWGDSQEGAFNALKAHLASSPILQLPNSDKPYFLRTDASNIGIGAVLLQENEETKEKFPVSYSSKKLLPREKSYATVEKEALAIVWGIQKYEPYLYGREFVLQTDHQALTYLHRAKQTNARIMRWALTLQPYRFRVESIKSSQNVGADFLSRAEFNE
ncbi:uncharacterized protein LOC121430260 [Lytechinus variegatus]|uniref:uncharacterized protein LOC121430260 n=1 Tax=Lytechinus variegatus TaxID=7654 RepID=UPI001BB2B05A|nr:uncharacterized protein LOC121430260 [Lytechinus variegatus]